MAVVRATGDVAQQLVHRVVQLCIAVVRHLQFVLAVRSPLSVVLIEIEVFNVLYRAFLTAHKFTVVLNPQGQQEGGDLGRADTGVAIVPHAGCLSRRLLVGADRYAAMPKVAV